MARAARPDDATPAADAGGRPTGAEGAEEPRGAAEPATCPVAWCPICLAVSVAQPLQPELVDHLLRAGNELLLAFRSVIEVRSRKVDEDEAPSGPTRLEKIDLG